MRMCECGWVDWKQQLGDVGQQAPQGSDIKTSPSAANRFYRLTVSQTLTAPDEVLRRWQREGG